MDFKEFAKNKIDEQEALMSTASVGNSTDYDGNSVDNSSIYKKKTIPQKGVLSRNGIVGGKGTLKELEKKMKKQKFDESTIFEKAIQMVEDPDMKEIVNEVYMGKSGKGYKDFHAFNRDSWKAFEEDVHSRGGRGYADYNGGILTREEAKERFKKGQIFFVKMINKE